MKLKATCEYRSSLSSSAICARFCASVSRSADSDVSGGSGVAAADEEAEAC